MIKKIYQKCISGYLMLVVLPGLLLVDGWVFFKAVTGPNVALLIVTVIIAIILFVYVAGFFMVHANQSRVLTIFGSYVGSAREPGLRWVNPFYARKTVSLRVRNFDCDTLKVNDSSGTQ